METRKRNTMWIAVIGGIVLVLILILSTIWMGRSARADTESAVRSVSLLYLDELAGRREQVVADNLQEKINVIETALELMTEEDLSDLEHLQAYQTHMKRLFVLEKFAFVDTDGLIYTSLGMQTDIDQYHFDYLTINGPEISIKNLGSEDKKVIIAVPVDMSFQGKDLVVCFMEIDMEEMLAGVSMDAQAGGATFCNIYTGEGIALTNAAWRWRTTFWRPWRTRIMSRAIPMKDWCGISAEGKKGEVSFTYNGIRETLSYVPVTGTDWFLTYLIRESVISDKISAISERDHPAQHGPDRR